MSLGLEQYGEKVNELSEVSSDKFFRIYLDSVTGKFRLVSSSQDAFDLIRKGFTTVNQQAFFVNKYGYDIDENVSAINEFGYFQTGLIFEVLRFIKLHYGSCSCVHMTEKCKKYIRDYMTPLAGFCSKNPISDFVLSNVSDDTGRNDELEKEGKGRIIPRDYQENAIKSIIYKGYGRGLIELPTSSGKSNVIANLIWNIHKKFNPNFRYLVFVPNKQLVEQMYKDFLDYGYDPKLVTRLTAFKSKKEGSYDPSAMIIVSNRQYLFNNQDKLPKIDVLINDEVHQDSVGSSTLDFVNGLDCKFKVGLSGTLPKKDKYHKWCLQGVFGDVLYAEDIVKLQEQGYITKLNLKFISIIDDQVEANRNLLFNLNPIRKYQVDDPSNGIAFNDAFNDEVEYIKKNGERLYYPIFKEIEKLEGNVLVLFDKIEFGTNMFEMAKEQNLRNSSISYIDGSTEVSVREEIRKHLEDTGNNILFANVQIMGTGINIKRLNNLVFFISSKSSSRIIQSCGRALRLHKDKDRATIIDINFNFKYSQKHFRERKMLYANYYQKKKADEYLTIHV